MSTSNHRGALILKRHFVRKAMGLEIELDITQEELGQLWSAHEELHISKLEIGGPRTSSQNKPPQDAAVTVDGEEMDTDWDEPATEWMTAKKAAVRQVLGCMMNDAANLPQVGRKINRIVQQQGTVDIYFEDGSFVSAQVTDPLEPQTGCGCKKAHCAHTKEAAPTIDMVAAVWKNELLGAMDVRKHGAKDMRFWGARVDPPFELYMLKDVPMDLARPLNDFPVRASRLQGPRKAWSIARQHADNRSFKKRLR